MTLLILYLMLALGVSFLCSLLEAGLLSVPLSHVRTMVDRGEAAGRRLQEMKEDIDRPLSAILTLNTVAHTVGAAGVGAQAQVVFGRGWVSITSAVLTFLILILSEIVPKTLGAVHAKRLAGFTAATCYALVVGLYPLVVLCQWISGFLSSRDPQASMSRDEVASIASLGQSEGFLRPGEAGTIRNVLAMRSVHVKDIMTPRSVVQMLHREATVEQVLADERSLRFSRQPVYGDGPDDLVGLVHRHDILSADRQGRRSQPVAELMRPIRVIPAHATVADALEQFVEHGEHLFQVVDEYGGTAGIVTLEDAMETLLGTEIVDETDRVVDMQALAKRLHQRRQRNLG